MCEWRGVLNGLLSLFFRFSPAFFTCPVCVTGLAFLKLCLVFFERSVVLSGGFGMMVYGIEAFLKIFVIK